MTTTMAESDTDILEVLDFEFEQPCENGLDDRIPDCSEKATWKSTLTCCGQVFLLCETHLLAAQAFMSRPFFKLNHTYGPTACGAKDIKITFEKL